MSDNMMEQVLLIGSGQMAIEYARVLAAQCCPFTVIGRGKSSALRFTERTGTPVHAGGLDAWLRGHNTLPSSAIVAVNMQSLFGVTSQLLQCGVQNILLEKPGAMCLSEMEQLLHVAVSKKINLYVAYNRRFYASVDKALSIIDEDGGVRSFHFEFTEWSHKVAGLKKDRRELEKWFLANSTHVVDLAFFLGGKPERMTCHTSGSLEWHPASSIFSGAGISRGGALFSYVADWEAPGRWGVEALTRKHRLFLKPLEKLQMQRIGSVELEQVELDDRLDQQFKPGLYGEVRAFMHKDCRRLCSIAEHVENVKHYYKIANYNI